MFVFSIQIRPLSFRTWRRHKSTTHAHGGLDKKHSKRYKNHYDMPIIIGIRQFWKISKYN